jgi:hypothetical protein
MEIRVYLDETKQTRLHVVHVADAKTVTDSGVEQSNVSSLARYAKQLLVAQGKASEEEAEHYHYEA